MMMKKLGFDTDVLTAVGGLETASEIAQQADTLKAIAQQMADEQDKLGAFLAPLLARDDMRIILTGAGTSAFIGESLVPFLAEKMNGRLEAIATTDIVAGERLYLDPDQPTLLISFGRSGNSPESVAAIDIVDSCITESYHLAVTCNAEGALSRRMEGAANSYALNLPDAVHDRSFPMTSSFTGMMLAAMFALIGNEAMQPRAARIAASAEQLLAQLPTVVPDWAWLDCNRVVYLGSNGFQGLAREAALKLLELTDGDVVAVHDTPLGFRHGPKTIITANTLIVLILSNDPYTRRYDLDLLTELRRDSKARMVIAMSAQPVDHPSVITIPDMADAADVDLLIPMILFPQIYAFHRSLQAGKRPDTPNAEGHVNRVVKGVTIHPLAA